MNYQNLSSKQIYLNEVSYTLDDFARDFRKKVVDDWGRERVDQCNASNNSLYKSLFILVVLSSQHKSTKVITEMTLGIVNEETLKITEDIINMYKKEAEILEGLQMKMFIENLRLYYIPDSLNLKLLNKQFFLWTQKILDLKSSL